MSSEETVKRLKRMSEHVPREFDPIEDRLCQQAASDALKLVNDRGYVGAARFVTSGDRTLRVHVRDVDARDDERVRDSAHELLAACEALINAPHQEHFAARLNDEEMRGIEMIAAAIARAKGTDQ